MGMNNLNLIVEHIHRWPFTSLHCLQSAHHRKEADPKFQRETSRGLSTIRLNWVESLACSHVMQQWAHRQNVIHVTAEPPRLSFIRQEEVETIRLCYTQYPCCYTLV